jgi:hypothetical protein
MSRVLFALTVQALLGYIHGVQLNILEATGPYHSSTVKMACIGDTSSTVAALFYKVGPPDTELEVEGGNTVELTLEIGPEEEGEYYCEINQNRSDSVTLVGECACMKLESSESLCSLFVSL